MQNNTVLILVATATGGGLISVIAYYIARFMRGTIKLALPRTGFNPGDAIVGSFDLRTKTAIQGNRLLVSLIGMQVTTTREEGKTTQTRTQEIYRDDVLVEEARSYPAGFMATYSFELATPNMQSPSYLNSAVGQMLTAAVRLLSDRTTRIKWKVEARLDAKGVDLATSKSVSIHVGQLI